MILMVAINDDVDDDDGDHTHNHYYDGKWRRYCC